MYPDFSLSHCASTPPSTYEPRHMSCGFTSPEEMNLIFFFLGREKSNFVPPSICVHWMLVHMCKHIPVWFVAWTCKLRIVDMRVYVKLLVRCTFMQWQVYVSRPYSSIANISKSWNLITVRNVSCRVPNVYMPSSISYGYGGRYIR